MQRGCIRAPHLLACQLCSRYTSRISPTVHSTGTWQSGRRAAQLHASLRRDEGSCRHGPLAVRERRGQVRAVTSSWSSCSVSTLRILMSLVRDASSPTCRLRQRDSFQR